MLFQRCCSSCSSNREEEWDFWVLPLWRWTRIRASCPLGVLAGLVLGWVERGSSVSQGIFWFCPAQTSPWHTCGPCPSLVYNTSSTEIHNLIPTARIPCLDLLVPLGSQCQGKSEWWLVISEGSDDKNLGFGLKAPSVSHGTKSSEGLAWLHRHLSQGNKCPVVIVIITSREHPDACRLVCPATNCFRHRGPKKSQQWMLCQILYVLFSREKWLQSMYRSGMGKGEFLLVPSSWQRNEQ